MMWEEEVDPTSRLDLLCDLGMKRENVRVSDRTGVLHSGRANLPTHKQRYADANDDTNTTVASVLVVGLYKLLHAVAPDLQKSLVSTLEPIK
jgi:malic enzyme